MDFIDRKISEKLIEAFKKNSSVTLTGPRQAGKSTLIKKLFPELPYVNLESEESRTLALEDPIRFIQKYSEGAIIDEAQRVPSIFSSIQVAIDEKNKPGMFVISGSQNFLFLESISQSLAGRTAIFHLTPLSKEEVQSKCPRTLEERMFYGGYPRIYDFDLNPTDWIESYLQTFVERDIRILKNVMNLDQFRLFIRMCANRAGQILDLTALGNDCGITSTTAKSWLSLLETSFIVFRLQPYYKNFNKRLIKSPKLYFWDTGLLSYLLQIKNPSEFDVHPHRGHIFENYIVSEIKKSILNHKGSLEVFYWKDKKVEVDCVYETGFDKISALEIKSGKSYSADYRKSLDYFQKIAGDGISKNIIYAGQSSQELKGGINLIQEDEFDFQSLI